MIICSAHDKFNMNENNVTVFACVREKADGATATKFHLNRLQCVRTRKVRKWFSHTISIRRGWMVFVCT